MNKNEQQKTRCRWRRFSHKAYAVFRSLHCEVSIGVLGVAMLTSCSFVNPASDDELQKGDLLFCIEPDDSEGLGGAIATVTDGVSGQSITHVAIAVTADRVLEAIPSEGVRVINLSDFLKEAGPMSATCPTVIVERLRDTTGVGASIERALKFLGRPYDHLYLPDDSAIYCSELVQLSYQRPDGTPVFAQQPMSFRDSSGQIAPFWTALYAEHSLRVPEGCPGTNPGAMSRDEALRIVPVKWRN